MKDDVEGPPQGFIPFQKKLTNLSQTNAPMFLYTIYRNSLD